MAGHSSVLADAPPADGSSAVPMPTNNCGGSEAWDWSVYEPWELLAVAGIPSASQPGPCPAFIPIKKFQHLFSLLSRLALCDYCYVGNECTSVTMSASLLLAGVFTAEALVVAPALALSTSTVSKAAFEGEAPNLQTKTWGFIVPAK